MVVPPPCATNKWLNNKRFAATARELWSTKLRHQRATVRLGRISSLPASPLGHAHTVLARQRVTAAPGFVAKVRQVRLLTPVGTRLEGLSLPRLVRMGASQASLPRIAPSHAARR